MECQAKEDVDNDKFSKTNSNFSGMAAQHLSMELCFTFYPVVPEYQFATSQRH